MSEETTKAVVADYIQHKLQQQLNWSWSPDPRFNLSRTRNGSKKRICEAMRTFGSRFEQRFVENKEEIENLERRIPLTHNIAQANFFGVVRNIFDEGVTWGRIIALIAFSARLSVKYVNKEMPDLVDQIYEWTISYFDEHLVGWINTNGGWEGFADHFEKQSQNGSTFGWYATAAAAAAVCGGLAVLLVK